MYYNKDNKYLSGVGVMKILKENINIKDLDLICRKVNRKRRGDGGNCGNFALALGRELFKYNIDFRIVICSDVDVQPEDDLDVYNETDSDIYHVAIMIDDKVYDCTGLTSIKDLEDIAYDQYGNSYPDISAWTYSEQDDNEFRKVFEWNTNFNTYPEYFQKLFKQYFEEGI